MRIGVDTGGTFTDFVVAEKGRVNILKVFSTPDDPGRAMLEGVRGLAERSAPGEALDIIHGTTVGTNCLLERRGARVALITTAGFEDLIEIRRQNRPKLYDLDVERDPPLVPRALRRGVRERTAAGGKVLLRPGPSELRRLVNQVRRTGAQSLAVCFLFSFANPENERRVALALRPLNLPISVSHEILPEYREYERLSTVVINAYLAPRLSAYFSSLEQSLTRTRRAKVARLSKNRGRLFVMQSSGGIMTAARASSEPVRTILSGPAGGVVAAWKLSGQIGASQAISFDMGGTSTDVCLLPPRATSEILLEGLPIALSVLDIHSVGAGGGSLARVDAGGALRVGPESAGAIPGPICYRRGGRRPTVTDANLLLGRLDPDFFLGGQFRLDTVAAKEGFEEFLRFQGRLRRSYPFKAPLTLAAGIVRVSNATMERALRVISVERGHDPRDFMLVSFGGAGGVHAADLARSLKLKGVVVPPNPGAFSALGIVVSDAVKDVSHSVLLPVPQAGEPSLRPAGLARFLKALEKEFERLERAARAQFNLEGLAGARAKSERRLDVRYAGQSYELSLPFTTDFARRFHAEHEKTHGYAHPGRPIEVVNLRARLTIRTPQPQPAASRPRGSGAPEAVRPPRPAKQKNVWFHERFSVTPVYEREGLRAGTLFKGPALVVEYSSTTLVPPDFECQVDGLLNLRLRQIA